MGDRSTIDAQCHADRTCSPSGLSAASQARTFGVVSDVGFALGGAGVLVSAILFLVSPSRSVQPTASAEAHGGFVGLRATW
jgi:hypothetical protein